MKKVLLWLAVVIIVCAIFPFLVMLAAGGIATLAGCDLHEGSTSSCRTPVGDISEILYLMGVFGWLIFFSVPIGFLGLILALILFVVSLLRSQ